jgi:hypothetical protein
MRILIGLTIMLASAIGASAQQRQPNPPRDLWCRDMMIIEGTVQYCMAYTYE